MWPNPSGPASMRSARAVTVNLPAEVWMACVPFSSTWTERPSARRRASSSATQRAASRASAASRARVSGGMPASSSAVM